MIHLNRSFIVIALITLCSCKYDALPQPILSSICDTLVPTYSSHVKEIIDQNCATSECHVSGTGIPGDFRNYASLRSHTDDFELYVIDLKDDPINGMPPNIASNSSPDDLSMNDFEIMKCWIEQGYPE